MPQQCTSPEEVAEAQTHQGVRGSLSAHRQFSHRTDVTHRLRRCAERKWSRLGTRCLLELGDSLPGGWKRPLRCLGIHALKRGNQVSLQEGKNSDLGSSAAQTGYCPLLRTIHTRNLVLLLCQLSYRGQLSPQTGFEPATHSSIRSNRTLHTRRGVNPRVAED